jgi:hypothetical protein
LDTYHLDAVLGGRSVVGGCDALQDQRDAVLSPEPFHIVPGEMPDPHGRWPLCATADEPRGDVAFAPAIGRYHGEQNAL